MAPFETAIDLMEQDHTLTPKAAADLLIQRRAQGLSQPSALDNPAVNPGMTKLQAEQQAAKPKPPQSQVKSR